MGRYISLDVLYDEQYRNSPSYINDCEQRYPLWQVYQVNYKKVSTCDLLMMLKSYWKSRSNDEIFGRKIIREFPDYERPPYPSKIYNAIKRELKTRPHIPNKEQRKKIRQENAKRT